MTMTVLVAIFIAIVARFMADEVKAWSSWLHRKMLRLAVAKLPKQYQERYEEEWDRELEECPGEIFKLVYSIGLLSAALGIRKAVLKKTLDSTLFASLKRAFDIVFSSIMLIILLPYLVAIAIAVKLETGGPVFYLSDRIGRKGRVFHCAKFRTMVQAPKGISADIQAHESEAQIQANSATMCVTRVGRFLRKHSLDELPLFFNVLRGDMSLVGPRAPTLPEVTRSKLSGLRRSDIKPGVTGLWQTLDRENRSALSPEFVDQSYVENASIWLDFKILVRTLSMVCLRTEMPRPKPVQDARPPDDADSCG
jgi:lipopolysaccharide/colanic/teichoic acid biosynthesis glycosyltransferase